MMLRLLESPLMWAALVIEIVIVVPLALVGGAILLIATILTSPIWGFAFWRAYRAENRHMRNLREQPEFASLRRSS